MAQYTSVEDILTKDIDQKLNTSQFRPVKRVGDFSKLEWGTYLNNEDASSSPDILLRLLSTAEDEDELEKMLLMGKGAAIWKAARNNDLESVKYLLTVAERLDIEEYMLSYNTYAILLDVAKANLPDMYLYLYNYLFNVINSLPKENCETSVAKEQLSRRLNASLTQAARCGNLEFFENLRSKGAIMNLVVASQDRDSSMHLYNAAVDGGNLDILDIILPQMDSKSVDGLLYYIIQKDALDILKHVELRLKVDFCKYSCGGFNDLMVAAVNVGHDEIAKYLYSKGCAEETLERLSIRAQRHGHLKLKMYFDDLLQKE